MTIRPIRPTTVVLIEDKASGTELIQELITDGCHAVTRYQPTGDKTMRLHSQTVVCGTHRWRKVDSNCRSRAVARSLRRCVTRYPAGYEARGQVPRLTALSPARLAIPWNRGPIRFYEWRLAALLELLRLPAGQFENSPARHGDLEPVQEPRGRSISAIPTAMSSN
jgi:hypothetical protein